MYSRGREVDMGRNPENLFSMWTRILMEKEHLTFGRISILRVGIFFLRVKEILQTVSVFSADIPLDFPGVQE